MQTEKNRLGHCVLLSLFIGFGTGFYLIALVGIEICRGWGLEFATGGIVLWSGSLFDQIQELQIQVL